MKIPCKNSPCTGQVDFDKDENTIGNCNMQLMRDSRINIKVSGAIEPGKTVGVLNIVQPQYAELKNQSVYFQRGDDLKIRQVDRFYLTCDTCGKTSVYEINIEDD